MPLTFCCAVTANGPVIDVKAAEESRKLLSVFITKLQARLTISPAQLDWLI